MADLDVHWRWRRPKDRNKNFVGIVWSQCDVDAWLGGLGDL